MAAKQIKTQIKVAIKAGEASPAPPLGPILGQHGVSIMDFVKQYNDKTQDKKGQIVPAVITIYEDRSFEFELRAAPVAAMIKAKLNLEKGSGEPHAKKVGKLTRQMLEEIAKDKMEDLNTTDLEAAMRIVAGQARSMGIDSEEI